MERRRALAYARIGIAYPVGSVAAAVGLAWVLGWDPGLVVLALSMAAAATLAGVTLSETGGMRPPEADRGREQQRGILGLGGNGGGGSADGDVPDVARSRRARLRVFSLGLFVLTVALVLVLGGVVPGL
ncbi:hypothetical protein [Halobaculum rubrum]|uniref:hypothetical protein n=1 Tax=Halobaculum rubrum TaxID=2872158 RepID=UPI001CA43106|nr:hypothetical protein [Halobaculum rubrum]QZY00909.1 hypothetical protein K6T25_07595 [Halobaculum rubrum]